LEELHDIIEKCKRQDRQGQRVLYEKYYAFALKTCFRYTGQYEWAVDATNDGFIKVFRYIGQFSPERAVHLEALLLGWMKKIMIHTAIDQLRQAKKRPESISLSEASAARIQAAEGAESHLLYKELITHLGCLSEGYRLAFNMSAIDGYSYNEIAEMLGITPGTVRSNFFRAKKILQNLLVQIERENIYVRPE
jgi:RNA polymerase sigma factor (sigma-70 family)